MASIYRFSDFELNCRTRELLRQDVPVTLPARCFECLQYLIEQRKHAVSRDELAEAVFGRSNVSDAQIGQVVLRTRRAIGDDGQHQDLIRTVPQYGYRWVGKTAGSDASLDTSPALASTPTAAPGLLRPWAWRRRVLGVGLLCAATAASGLVAEHGSPLAGRAPEAVLLQAKEDFIAGRNEHGLASLDHLLEAQGDQGDARFRARTLLQRARFEMRLGRHADAEQDFSAVIGLVDHRAEPNLAGRAHNGRGMARIALGKLDAAHQDLRRAREALIRSGDLRSLRWIDANFGLLRQRRAGAGGGQAPAAVGQSSTFVGEDDAKPGAAGEDTSRPSAAVHSELASLHRQLLEWPQAQRHAEEAWTLRAQVGDPANRRAIALDMAETLIGNGRLQEAQALLGDPVLATAGDGHRASMLQVRLLWQRGEVDAALELSDDILANAGPYDDPTLLRQLQRQRLQLGLETGAPAPDGIVATPASDDAVDAWLIRALSAQYRDKGPEAGFAYRQAMQRALDDGTPAQLVAVARAYLPWLIQRRSLQDASALAERIAPLAGRDYDAAMLQLRLSQAVGDLTQWQASAADVRRLAGDRPLAVDFQSAVAL